MTVNLLSESDPAQTRTGGLRFRKTQCLGGVVGTTSRIRPVLGEKSTPPPQGRHSRSYPGSVYRLPQLRPSFAGIYFARRSDDLIKIGVSNNIKARLTQLTPINGRVEYLGWLPGGRAGEQAIHAVFAKERVEGEWFTPSPDLFGVIQLVWPGRYQHESNWTGDRAFAAMEKIALMRGVCAPGGGERRKRELEDRRVEWDVTVEMARRGDAKSVKAVMDWRWQLEHELNAIEERAATLRRTLEGCELPGVEMPAPRSLDDLARTHAEGAR